MHHDGGYIAVYYGGGHSFRNDHYAWGRLQELSSSRKNCEDMALAAVQSRGVDYGALCKLT